MKTLMGFISLFMLFTTGTASAASALGNISVSGNNVILGTLGTFTNGSVGITGDILSPYYPSMPLDATSNGGTSPTFKVVILGKGDID